MRSARKILPLLLVPVGERELTVVIGRRVNFPLRLGVGRRAEHPGTRRLDPKIFSGVDAAGLYLYSVCTDFY